MLPDEADGLKKYIPPFIKVYQPLGLGPSATVFDFDGKLQTPSISQVWKYPNKIEQNHP